MAKRRPPRLTPVIDLVELTLIVILVAGVAFAAGVRVGTPRPVEPMSWSPITPEMRQALADELKTVRLKNCVLKRYGSRFDGGYLMCANLMEGVTSAYSYGIDQEDNWGCDVSRQLGIAIHQYDCFTKARPVCSGGRFIFHDECVGPRKERIDGRPFDAVPSQIERNGDTGKSLLLKMDVEGAEWESLLATPDSVLDTFVQLPMELHLRLASDAKFLPLIKRLKDRFYLVNLHFNNDPSACFGDGGPISSRAFQALWVNKRIGIVDPEAASPVPLDPLNEVDNAYAPDCQPEGPYRPEK